MNAPAATDGAPTNNTAVIKIIPTRFDVHIPRAGHRYRRTVHLAPPTQMPSTTAD